MAKHRRRNRPDPVKIAPGDRLGKWLATFCVRRNPILTLAPVGPVVKASNPKELEERTDEALVEVAEKQRPS